MKMNIPVIPNSTSPELLLLLLAPIHNCKTPLLVSQEVVTVSSCMLAPEVSPRPPAASFNNVFFPACVRRDTRNSVARLSLQPNWTRRRGHYRLARGRKPCLTACRVMRFTKESCTHHGPFSALWFFMTSHIHLLFELDHLCEGQTPSHRPRSRVPRGR